MTTYIYGASDDLVEFEGDFREEYMVGMAGIAYFHLTADGVGMRVEAHYGENGTWLLGVAPLDDGEPIPWDIWFETERDKTRYGNDYSAVLAIETPEDVQVVQVDKHGKPVGEE